MDFSLSPARRAEEQANARNVRASARSRVAIAMDVEITLAEFVAARWSW